MLFILILFGVLAPSELGEAEAHDAEEGFTEDAAGHLACAQLAVDEDNGHFLYPEAEAQGGVFHLYLEGVALEADVVQADGLQHFARPADEARRGVAQRDAEYCADVGGGVVGHEDAADGPVHDVDPGDVAAADGDIVALVVAGGIEARQVGGRVAEVGIHLDDVVVAL